MIHIAVIGDRIATYVAQETIESALQHSARSLGTDVGVEWFATPSLESGASDLLAPADAVWCAPGSPYESLDGVLAGIEFAREHRRPFLGTCAGFQHAVIEFARNVLGVADAQHAEYGGTSADHLFIDELLCSLVGQKMDVRVVDDETRAIYGSDTATEQYYCRFGLDEKYTPALAAAGLVVTAVDTADGGARIMRLVDHPFFYGTLFVPQESSTAASPHPIVTAYVAAAQQHCC